MENAAGRSFWMDWSSLIQPARIAEVPWLELIRTTLTPASSNARIRSGCSQAGPRVAMILVRRIGARVGDTVVPEGGGGWLAKGEDSFEDGPN